MPRGRYPLTSSRDIRADSITADSIAAGGVASSEILDASIATVDIAANAVTGAKIPENALGSLEISAVAVDHADSSPKTILASDANNERIVHVRAVATEAAVGAPDLDVGSASTDPNGIVDDFGAGVWAIGDRFEGIILLPAGEALVATIATAGTAGAFNVFATVVTIAGLKRSQLGQDDLQPFGIPLSAFEAVDGAALGVAEDSADLFRAVGTNVHTLKGRTPQTATEAAAAVTQFVLPAEYVSGQTITVRIVSQFINGSGVDSGRSSFTDLSVFKQNDGAIGSDLCTTGAISPTADDTYADSDFTITPTGLVAGDVLNLLVTLSAVSDDGNATQLEIGEVMVLCDVKG